MDDMAIYIHPKINLTSVSVLSLVKIRKLHTLWSVIEWKMVRVVSFGIS